jgi:hypothetical protein
MDMARSYYSTVFEQSADEVWRVIRDFNNYPVWVDVRNVLYPGSRRRQRLLALSDVERSQTYAFAAEAPIPVWNFRATIRVTPVVDGERAFVEWWATFDCDVHSHDERIAFFRDAFAGWLGSLRRHLQRQVRAA